MASNPARSRPYETPYIHHLEGSQNMTNIADLQKVSNLQTISVLIQTFFFSTAIRTTPLKAFIILSLQL